MELKIIFIPFPTPGHIQPMADLAKTLASNGVECIIITTPANAPLFQTTANNPLITVHALPFPGADVGLPPGIENFSTITCDDMRTKLFKGICMLRKPVEDMIREKLLPLDCIVSDMFYPWTSDLAAEIGVPRVFQLTSSIFSLCCDFSVKLHAPHQQVENDDDLVTLPTLPHKIEMKKSQLPLWVRVPNGYTHLMDVVREGELKSTWVLANTIGEAEKEYEECYYKLTGIKVYNLGPLFLHTKEKNKPPPTTSVELDCWKTCLDWLDQKKPNSVLYVTFGSLTLFGDDQLKEIAAGLEASGHDFIWAVKRKTAEKKDGGEEWSADEFRKKMEASNKGLILQGWVPQLSILEHQAIGGMVTHCGWNTLLEGVTIAGVPLITWPQFAEQFYNERLVVDVLKIGVSVGVSRWCDLEDAGKDLVGRDKMETAVRAVMDNSQQATEMRLRAKKLSEGSKRAVQDGSSQANLMAFLDELKSKRSKAV